MAGEITPASEIRRRNVPCFYTSGFADFIDYLTQSGALQISLMHWKNGERNGSQIK
jgi:hypothetical protein